MPTVRPIVLPALVAGLCAAAQAATITQWNFNSVSPDSNTTTGTTTASLGTGTASLLGGTTGAFASGDSDGGSSDPASGDDSGWNISTWAAQGTGSGTRGVQFSLSTVGYENVSVVWDNRASNTMADTVQFQYSLDGASFTSSGLTNDGVFRTAGSNAWNNLRTVDLSSIAGADNNASFAFRIVAVFSAGSTYAAANSGSAYSTSGTLRFDMVTIGGDAIAVVPLPTGAGLGAFGLLAVASRRRR